MKRPAVILAAVVAVLPATTAAAQPRQTCIDGEVIVDDDDTVELRINPNTVTAVYFAGPIDRLDVPDWPGLEVTDRGDHLTIHPQLLPQGADDLGSLELETAAGVVTLALRAAPSPTGADDRCRIIPRDYRQWDIELEQEARAMCAKDLADRDAEVAKTRSELLAFSAEQVDQVILQDALTGIESEPLDPASGEVGTKIRFAEWRSSLSRRLVLFAIENRDSRPYHVAELQIFDRTQATNHAGPSAFTSGRTDNNERFLTIIEPWTRVTGAVRLRDPNLVRGSLTLYISEPSRRRPIMSEPISWWHSGEAATDGHRENGGRTVSVQLETVSGFMWVGHGLSGPARLEESSGIMGLAVRVTYGLHDLFAFEADLAAARSGDARFDDVTMNGTHGDLLRHTTFGRARVGGVLRMGKRIIPTVHISLGVQGAEHSSTFMANSERLPGPDTPFEFSMILSVGTGIDVQLNDRIILGARLSAWTPMGGAESDLFGRAAELGLHVGYTLKP